MLIDTGANSLELPKVLKISSISSVPISSENYINYGSAIWLHMIADEQVIYHGS